MNRRESFDKDAKRYDESRLSYPDEVIDWIIDKTGVVPGETLLEIGPGTGQATLPFARRGYPVHCVELGGNLASLLREKAAGYQVTVDVAAFEEWIPPQGFTCPMVLCATAFHWLDVNVKYRKSHELLKEGGYLALLWNGPSASGSPLIDEAYRRLFSHYPMATAQTPPDGREADELRREEIDQSGYFRNVDYLRHRWFPVETRERFIEGFFSQSSFLSLNAHVKKQLEAEIRGLLSGLDETIRTEFTTSVFIAQSIVKSPG